MRTAFGLFSGVLLVLGAAHCLGQTASVTRNPADNLPPHIRWLTWFGKRADWSHDSKRILFVKKTFGNVYELELATGIIHPMAHRYPHHGYTRALYLANGNVLLSGLEKLDPLNRGHARVQC